MQRLREMAKAFKFCKQAQKVTGWTQCIEKKNAMCCSVGSIDMEHTSVYAEQEGGEKTHSSVQMGRLSYGELPTRAV